MKVSQYIRDRWLSIGILLLTAAAAAAFLWMMGTPAPVLAAVTLLYLAGFLLMGALDCHRKKAYYDRLERAWSRLEEKAYLAEVIERPDFYDGQLLCQIVQKSGKYLSDVIAAQQQEADDYRQYIQAWVHEIKTPIAAQRLLLENHRSPLASSLAEEVEQVEAYVEQLLYYAKSGSVEEDYLIAPVPLKGLVMEVIRRHSKMMAAAQVLPRLENLEHTVLTDSKWLRFVLGQLTVNAVKYRDSGKKSHLLFRVEEREGGMLALSVEDNGIGIPEGDLSRVFRRGFTGENGRRVQKSTGMGLYLCKTLCDKMGVPLQIRSRQGEGTALTLLLKEQQNPQ